ncbi:hypothetical protein EDD21DRAFT_403442 [Dissophora ornata]|nr:hypothetical protein BGZ58_010426 [Dissophora ornata]KAI8602702.1 hypothetical protein EDD21DRAFT_403442 [Dissophora ornata]
MPPEMSVPEPRDCTLNPISAPLVTSYSLKALIDSPQFRQTIVLSSGRTVSYATCGSKTGIPVLYFYGLGGSSRLIASMHAQAVRLDIKLLSIDRPGTGFTDPYKASSDRRRKQKGAVSKNSNAWNRSKSAHDGHSAKGEDNINAAVIDLEDENVEQQTAKKPSSSSSSSSASSSNGRKPRSIRRFSDSKMKQKPITPTRKVNERIHHTCLEAMAVVDQLIPGAKFGLMSHSCGIYYVMHMLSIFPERIQQGPISLLTPWVPFNECPETTSSTFKFLKHIPRGLVWAVTSSMNHLGSVILSSSNALSGTMSSKNLNGSTAEDEEDRTRQKRQSGDNSDSDSGSVNGSSDGRDKDVPKKPADPFVLQFSDAFDQVVLPALVQDMNRQHSNGYNSEIQMCISDVGFDLASVPLPSGITINAYCGHLDNVVPMEAARDMGEKCGWKIHEFRYSGHGGPRILMYALEDYALAVQAMEAAKASEDQWSEKLVEQYS